MDGAAVLDSVAEILAPFARSTSSPSKPAAFASLSSNVLGPLEHEVGFRLLDVCYVVLPGDQLRLAIYALVARGAERQHWRVRLLSGDAKTGSEKSFHYTVCQVLGAKGSSEASLPVSARAFAQEEA